MDYRMASSNPYPNTHLLTFSPLLTQLQTSYIGICSQIQHWGEVYCDALYLYPLAFQVDCKDSTLQGVLASS